MNHKNHFDTEMIQPFMLSARRYPVDGLRMRDESLDIFSSDVNIALEAILTVVAIERTTGCLEIVGFSDSSITSELEQIPQFLEELKKNEISGNRCSWREATIGKHLIDFLVAPVHATPGRRRMAVISVFARLDQNQRADAEARCHLRRPLATAYLDLWQVDQARAGREFALEATLSAMQIGMILLDDGANVLYSNHAAKRILEAADGLKLNRNRLVTNSLRDNVRLAVALQHVCAPVDALEGEQRAPMLALERADRSSLILLAMPIGSPADSEGDRTAALYIVDPRISFAEHVRPLCRIYKLSPVETDLACLLAKGMTLGRAAESMHLKEQTLRSCLRSIFYKTGTSRQTDLVLMLLSSVVPTISELKVEIF